MRDWKLTCEWLVKKLKTIDDLNICNIVNIEQSETRLQELGLDLRALLEVIAKTTAERNRVTANHPRGSLGFFTYAEGNRFLRDVLIVGGAWLKDESLHLEGIRSANGQIRVLFQNVHRSCDIAINPRAISEKKNGSVTVCQTNKAEFDQLQLALNNPNESYLQRIAPINGQQVYYLMMDLDGAVELSKPVITDGKFSNFLERIFITEGDQVLNVDRKQDEQDTTGVNTLEELNKLVTPKL